MTAVLPTIRLVFEFGVHTAPITEQLASESWGPPVAADAAERPQQLAYEQQLAQVLDADPALRRQLVLNRVVELILPRYEGIEDVEKMLRHAYQPLVELLINRLPEHDRAAVREYCEAHSLVGEYPEYFLLAVERLGLPLQRVLVEDEQGILASSDDRPRPGRKKRKGGGGSRP